MNVNDQMVVGDSEEKIEVVDLATDEGVCLFSLV